MKTLADELVPVGTQPVIIFEIQRVYVPPCTSNLKQLSNILASEGYIFLVLSWLVQWPGWVVYGAIIAQVGAPGRPTMTVETTEDHGILRVPVCAITFMTQVRSQAGKINPGLIVLVIVYKTMEIKTKHFSSQVFDRFFFL